MRHEHRRRLLHLLRHFSSATSQRANSNPLLNFPYRHRRASLPVAQQALADYLHATRSIPFPLADHIACNSPCSLSSLLSSLSSLDPSAIVSSLRRRVSFHPPDILPFFLESIGLPPSHPQCPPNLSDLLPAASALVDFGFPWNHLGVLYLHSPALFRSSPASLTCTLSRFSSSSGLDRLSIVSVCLAFPAVLDEPHTDADLLLRDMRLALHDFHPSGTIEENVRRCLRICRRVALMYEIGCGKGRLEEFMDGRWKPIIASEHLDLEGAMGFLCALGAGKEEAAGQLILEHPELLEADFLRWEISMPGYLESAGFGDKQLGVIRRRHPYVIGRNRLANLPACLRVLGLDKWLLGKVRSGDLRYLSREFLDHAVRSDGDKADLEFQQGLEGLHTVRVDSFLMPKLGFLQSVGFGRNGITCRAIKLLTGQVDNLKERFSCLLDMGIEYSDLCRMISLNPKLLNRNPDVIREKVDFLCNDLGLTVRYLNRSPGYLSFHLENRIKPRYRMLDWLRSKGVLDRKFSPSMVISVNEKTYIDYLRMGHPAAIKFWFEVFKFSQHRDLYPLT